MKLVMIIAVLGLSLISSFAISDEDTSISGKAFPEVTFDKVQEIFGHNLDTDDTVLKTLLLAIGMDHTTTKSPNASQRIGIPYIIHDGPAYWVRRLQSGDNSLEVLVNNALLLLYTIENIPKAKETAFILLKASAEKGYWPADYYIAEVNLEEHLTQDYLSATPSTGLMDNPTKTIAKDTMARYNRCADMGFAPCQFRIGFWLSGSPKSLSDGLNILRAAIHTTRADTRYQGVLDGAMIMAAREIVFKGKQAGIDSVVREEYANLIKQQLAVLSESGNRREDGFAEDK
ncbi:hypothetical protein [Microbulbifer sp. THAF38]|uniref:hypothetical protein n=1 Tax=Microbulbifer sp. THAF38 TaxID=2587856 RepID=UPI0012685A54|nr:hypothetical protein [Microbulbifer sp. THAF38]QFT57129.1 hypothetical protein FIU95_21490 [Microbulbifer sp. THAF38]